jgi:hypothetical protein
MGTPATPVVTKPFSAEPVKAAPASQFPQYVPVRAKFTCTEIMHTQRGVTVLTLAAAYEGVKAGETALIPGASPKGTISIEVGNDWAQKNVVHGSVFYLVSTNQVR